MSPEPQLIVAALCLTFILVGVLATTWNEWELSVSTNSKLNRFTFGLLGYSYPDQLLSERGWDEFLVELADAAEISVPSTAMNAWNERSSFATLWNQSKGYGIQVEIQLSNNKKWIRLGSREVNLVGSTYETAFLKAVEAIYYEKDEWNYRL